MIVVDSSALMAVLNKEGDAASMARCLADASGRIMSAGNYLECGIVARNRFGPRGADRFRSLVAELDIEVVPVDGKAADEGLNAFLRFGKGSGHAASLNFGDCFAYALAKARNLPLLFKGNDFRQTDVVPVLKLG